MNRLINKRKIRFNRVDGFIIATIRSAAGKKPIFVRGRRRLVRAGSIGRRTMKRIFATVILLGFAMVIYPALLQAAAPDQFIGDTAIYGGQPSTLQPNVLVIIDTSTSMDQAADPTATGAAYNPDYTAAPYPSASSCNDSNQNPLNPCETTAVYDVSYGFVNGDVSQIVPSCTFDIKQGNNHRTTTVTPQSKLKNNGQYNGPALTPTGTDCCYQPIKIGSTTYPKGQCANTTYYLGNYVNWYWDQPQGSQSKISIARDVIGKLIDTTYGVNFGVMTYQYTPSTGQGGQFLQKTELGANYVATVKTMEDIYSGPDGTTTNRDALILAINDVVTAGNTPTGESLFEAMRYFAGQAPAFGSTIGVTGGLYTSPIQYSCQKNYLILITDGMANADDSSTALNFISNKFKVGTTLNYDGGYCFGYGSPAYTTCNDNYQNHLAAGVARYMYEYDLKTGQTTTVSTQNNVVTYTIGFGLGSSDAEAVDLLRLTADDHHGRGANYLAKSAQTLNQNLTKIINKIYQVTGAFVAPVVPVNPENKLQFGSRVYMGFFEPGEGGFWRGNLKKFGLDANLNVVDTNGNLATYVDADGNGFDDRDNAKLADDKNTNASDGSFRQTATAARSYWTPSGVMDSGLVNLGGVGALLVSRPNTLPTSVTSAITGSVRNIYTYTGTSQNLTDSSNGFNVGNTSNITAALLGLPGSIITTGTVTDVKMLINYVHGFDTYDELSTGNTNTADGSIKKRQWIMGDVLHSKPLVMSYATFTYTDEGDCTKNKNIIYVGTNDGMLHAFNDCDGSEAWAFIPPDVLPYLQYLRSSNHAYFVDSSIQSYKFDKDPGDGAIASSKHDSVVLVVGLRRGGGVTTEPGKGFYYILDVTDVAYPKLLGKFSNSTTGFAELGESWSEPKMGKIIVGSNVKLAAFIGGGYDNCNEDARFGATQTYSGSCINAIASADGGLDGSNLPITSSGSTAISSFSSSAAYKGRGVYVVEIATFPPSTSTSGLDFSNTGSIIWSYTFNSGNPLQYSMLSEIAALDFNGDGYVDRLYMGDSGGGVWRFDLSSTSPTSWTVTKIFTSNPGSSGYPTSTVDNTDIGRKIFYRPAVSPDRGMVWLFFGTGDREHPLNRAVEDRIYGLTDKGQTSAVTEAKLIDVTTDPIQSALTPADRDAAKAKLDLVSSPSDTTLYGWYIRLDGGDRDPVVNNPGEKVLSTVSVAAGNVYVTTYSPSTGATSTTSTNPCQLGNLGNGALYVLNYSSGAAVVNYDPNNDPTSSTYNFNKYAFAQSDTGKAHVLLRTDRKRTIGQGIPSSAVVICDPSDVACKWLVGCGGGICSDSAGLGGSSGVTQIYWRQK